MPLGINFAPTDQNQQEQNKPAGTPIQDAIKILSLRIPQFAGARGLAPDPLMQGQGAAGFPFGGQTPGGLDEFLRRLFSGGMPGMSPASVPPPVVRPGEDQKGPMEPAPQSPVPGGVKPLPGMQPGGGKELIGGIAKMPQIGGGPYLKTP